MSQDGIGHLALTVKFEGEQAVELPHLGHRRIIDVLSQWVARVMPTAGGVKTDFGRVLEVIDAEVDDEPFLPGRAAELVVVTEELSVVTDFPSRPPDRRDGLALNASPGVRPTQTRRRAPGRAPSGPARSGGAVHASGSIASRDGLPSRGSSDTERPRLDCDLLAVTLS